MAKMKRLMRRVAAALAAVALAVTLLPIQAAAASPYIAADSVSGYPGNRCVVTVKGYNLAALASLEMSVYYDSEAMELVSATAQNMDMASVNTATAGEARLSGASLAGLNGTADLLRLELRIKDTAAADRYPLQVTVGEAYNTARTPLSIASVGGFVTVEEPVQQEKYAYFYLSGDKSTLQQDDELTVTVYSYNLNGTAAGKLQLTYDPEQLALVEVLPVGGLAEVATDRNTSHNGVVSVGFASTAAIKSGNLLQLRLRVVADVNDTATIRCAASDLYDAERSAVIGNQTSTSVTLQKKAAETDDPDLAVAVPAAATTGTPFTITVSLEGRSGLAAGDFAIPYDADKLTCQAVTASDSLAADGAYVIINPNHGEGLIQFSFLCADGVSRDTDLLTATFVPLAEGDYAFAAQAKTTPVNAAGETVSLEMTENTVQVKDPWFTITFVDDDGTQLSQSNVRYHTDAAAPEDPTKAPDSEYHYTFTGWKGLYQSVEADATVTAQYAAAAHVPVTDAYVAPGCLESGLTQGAHCADCGYVLTAQATIDALGHDLTLIPAKAATCLTEGNRNYYVCSRCKKAFRDSAATVETTAASEVLPALGHDFGEAVFTWSEDGKSATAVRVCEHDSKHILSGSAVITSKEKIPATCTEPGTTTYTATITLGGIEYTDTKDVVDIPAPGHKPGAAVRENEIAPTATAKGSYDSVVYCTVCHQELQRTAVIVDELGITFTGTVVGGSTGKVTVYQGDLPVAQVAISGDTFHLSAIKLGDYTVRITRNGYVTRTLPLAVTENSQEEMLLDTFIVRQGDVTGSLKAGDSVDVTDMQRLFEHLSGAATLTDTYALAVADVNSDGWVNILDYQALYMLLQ